MKQLLTLILPFVAVATTRAANLGKYSVDSLSLNVVIWGFPSMEFSVIGASDLFSCSA